MARLVVNSSCLEIVYTGNCNHMRCVVCTTSFCWLCGDLIDDGILPAHYDVRLIRLLSVSAVYD
jgi:hypothetical protein